MTVVEMTPENIQTLRQVATLADAAHLSHQLCTGILRRLGGSSEHPNVRGADAGAIDAFHGAASLHKLAELFDELSRAIRAGEFDRHVSGAEFHGGTYAQ